MTTAIQTRSPILACLIITISNTKERPALLRRSIRRSPIQRGQEETTSRSPFQSRLLPALQDQRGRPQPLRNTPSRVPPAGARS
jgi:hypothetical protein